MLQIEKFQKILEKYSGEKWKTVARRAKSSFVCLYLDPDRLHFDVVEESGVGLDEGRRDGEAPAPVLGPGGDVVAQVLVDVVDQGDLGVDRHRVQHVDGERLRHREGQARRPGHGDRLTRADLKGRIFLYNILATALQTENAGFFRSLAIKDLDEALFRE